MSAARQLFSKTLDWVQRNAMSAVVLCGAIAAVVAAYFAYQGYEVQTAKAELFMVLYCVEHESEPWYASMSVAPEESATSPGKLEADVRLKVLNNSRLQGTGALIDRPHCRLGKHREWGSR